MAARTTEEAKERLTEEMKGRLTEEMEGRLTEEMKGRLMEETKGRLTEKMADKTTKDAKGRLTDKNTEEARGRLTEKARGRLTERTPEKMDEYFVCFMLNGMIYMLLLLLIMSPYISGVVCLDNAGTSLPGCNNHEIDVTPPFGEFACRMLVISAVSLSNIVYRMYYYYNERQKPITIFHISSLIVIVWHCMLLVSLLNNMSEVIYSDNIMCFRYASQPDIECMYREDYHAIDNQFYNTTPLIRVIGICMMIILSEWVYAMYLMGLLSIHGDDKEIK